METDLSRREFLKTAGITLGAAALACSGAGCSAAQAGPQPETKVETPTFSFAKDQTMPGRILVTYATRTGSTVGVAEAIGETLSQRGYAVDVKPVKDNPSPDGYAAVLLGSAVNGANWLPEAVEYVRANQPALNRVPLGLFSVHIMNTGEDQKSEGKRKAYLKDVRPLLPAASEAFFAGMGLDPETASGFMRWFYRTFKIGLEGDCRDWDKIKGWAQSVQL